MPQSSSVSLTASDNTRRIKNRMAKYLVTAGGISALGALVLMFGYLAWVVAPLFFDASYHRQQASVKIDAQTISALAVDDHGRYAFTANPQGELAFWLNQPGRTSPVDTFSLPFFPSRWVTSAADNWFLAVGPLNSDQAALVQPDFSYGMSSHQPGYLPKFDHQALSSELAAVLTEPNTDQIALAVTHDELIVLTNDHHGVITRFEQSRATPAVTSKSSISTGVVVEELLATPDHHIFYARQGNQLLVYVVNGQHIRLRERVTLTDQPGMQVTQMQLLPGAYSLLTLTSDGQVTQWFDVLSHGQRHLTRIRDFELGQGVTKLLPNAFSKGFFGFTQQGKLENYYTTSAKQVLSVQAFSQSPDLAAISSNEHQLVAFYQHALHFSRVDMGFPEITFSSLWRKIWYEGYPKPQYVWQSTSGSNSFEPKFSLVPIAFGTIKAALFSMIFAVPIAVLAAIYTAYFMTPAMRRIVKPTIELMEALPTVIIGFLAGLWFAPIVERHLVSVVSMFVLLPVSMMAFGALWAWSPRRWRRTIKKGWHAALLFPVLAIIISCLLPLNAEFEHWFFGGDIRVFLAQCGINFDQRNVLVVGVAMGFAVVPTIFTIAEDAIFSVPRHLTYGSLALGATQWQTLSRVVLLTASPGIFSAIMMGLGRAVGETMIVLMATGNTPIMNWNIFEGMRTLAATIAIELPESEVGNTHFRLLFLAALILFVFTFCVNSLAEWIRLRLREKYRAL